MAFYKEKKRKLRIWFHWIEKDLAFRISNVENVIREQQNDFGN